MITNYSPNFSTPSRNINKIKYIIFHYTGMRSQNEAINRLLNVNSKVSCHYFIKKNGKIILMVPGNYEAWHAGKSNWKNDKSLNKSSIGIEISNKGHNHGYEKFSNNQILSLIKLVKLLIKKYKIKPEEIIFLSSNTWDVSGGGNYGYNSVWVNRNKAHFDNLDYLPKNEIGNLTQLLDIL